MKIVSLHPRFLMLYSLYRYISMYDSSNKFPVRLKRLQNTNGALGHLVQPQLPNLPSQSLFSSCNMVRAICLNRTPAQHYDVKGE